MFSPIMPFITEELYHEINPSFSGSIGLESYPEFDIKMIYEEEDEIDYIIGIIDIIRNLKSKMKLSMAAPLENIKIHGNSKLINKYDYILTGMMHIKGIEIINSDEDYIENQ